MLLHNYIITIGLHAYQFLVKNCRTPNDTMKYSLSYNTTSKYNSVTQVNERGEGCAAMPITYARCLCQLPFNQQWIKSNLKHHTIALKKLLLNIVI